MNWKHSAGAQLQSMYSDLVKEKADQRSVPL
jgi:hypothetical protein